MSTVLIWTAALFRRGGMATSASARIPPTETCIKRHSQIWKNAAMDDGLCLFRTKHSRRQRGSAARPATVRSNTCRSHARPRRSPCRGVPTVIATLRRTGGRRTKFSRAARRRRAARARRSARLATSPSLTAAPNPRLSARKYQPRPKEMADGVVTGGHRYCRSSSAAARQRRRVTRWSWRRVCGCP